MEIWSEIRREVLTGALSKRAAIVKYKVGWHTLKKMLAHDEPPGYRQANQRPKPKLERFLPGHPSNLQGDRTYRCRTQPPPNPQPARAHLGAPQPQHPENPTRTLCRRWAPAAAHHILEVVLAGHQVMLRGHLRRMAQPLGDRMGRVPLHPVGLTRSPQVREQPRPGFVAGLRDNPLQVRAKVDALKTSVNVFGAP